MVCDRDVDIESRGTSCDRIVGLIRVGGLDTSEALIAAGAAWDCVRYDIDLAISRLQNEARQQGRGLRADARAIP